LLSSIVLVAAVALAAEPVANATKQAGDLPHEPSVTRPLPDPVVRKKEWQEHPGTHHREYALPIENTKPDNNTRPNTPRPQPVLPSLTNLAQFVVDTVNATNSESARKVNPRNPNPVVEKVSDEEPKKDEGNDASTGRKKKGCTRVKSCPGPDCGAGPGGETDMERRNKDAGVEGEDLDDCGVPHLPTSCNPNPDPMLSTDIVDKLGLKTLYATMVAETDCLVCHELSEVLEQEIGFDGAECSNYQKIMKTAKDARNQALAKQNNTGTFPALEKKATMAAMVYRSCTGLSSMFKTQRAKLLQISQQPGSMLCADIGCCHKDD